MKKYLLLVGASFILASCNNSVPKEAKDIAKMTKNSTEQIIAAGDLEVKSDPTQDSSMTYIPLTKGDTARYVMQDDVFHSFGYSGSDMGYIESVISYFELDKEESIVSQLSESKDDLYTIDAQHVVGDYLVLLVTGPGEDFIGILNSKDFDVSQVADDDKDYEKAIVNAKHDYFMDHDPSYQKTFEFKLQILGNDRTSEEVFEAMQDLVKIKEEVDAAWNGK